MYNENELVYPAESTVGDQCLREVPAETATSELHRRISAAAYQLYLRRGKRRGHELEDWLDAEAYVLSELSAAVRELSRDEAAASIRRLAKSLKTPPFHKIC